jgi:hypothetical protein
MQAHHSLPPAQVFSARRQKITTFGMGFLIGFLAMILVGGYLFGALFVSVIAGGKSGTAGILLYLFLRFSSLALVLLSWAMIYRIWLGCYLNGRRYEGIGLVVGVVPLLSVFMVLTMLVLIS